MISRVYPILARYGSIFIYSYTVVLAAGALGGLLLTAWLARRQAMSGWIDAFLVVSLAALLVGRAGFIAVHWAYFGERPAELGSFTSGGLVYHGALLAGLAALPAWARWQGYRWRPLANLFGSAFVLICAAGWLACLLEGCAYGRLADLGPLATDLPDDLGVYAVRYQTQLAGFLLTLLLFAGVLAQSRRRLAPGLFWFALAGVSLIRLSVGLLRGDPALSAGPVRLDLLLDAALVLASLVLLQYERRQAREGAG